MGSTLWLRENRPRGGSINEEVWSESLAKNTDLLAVHPTRIAMWRNIEPGVVIRQIYPSVSLGPLGAISLSPQDVYSPLLNYCTSPDGLGLKENENFFPFAYDWRQDCRVTAGLFAGFIRKQDPTEESSIRIIAHSMGGIITRLMLLNDKEIAKRTNLFFQIASPVEGAAKAYYALKKRPIFNRIWDTVWQTPYIWDDTRYADLRKTVQSFPSLYQLLPPSTVTTLIDKLKQEYSALDSEVWDLDLHEHLKVAAEVHITLKRYIRHTSIQCIYSDCRWTDSIYEIDPERNFAILKTSRRERGDGTVTVHSATARTKTSDRHLINDPGSEHTKLCSHTKVYQLLRQEFV